MVAGVGSSQLSTFANQCPFSDYLWKTFLWIQGKFEVFFVWLRIHIHLGSLDQAIS